MYQFFKKAILETINTNYVTCVHTKDNLTYRGHPNKDFDGTIVRDLIEDNFVYRVLDLAGYNPITVKYTDSLYRYITVSVWDTIVSDIVLSRYDAIPISNNMQQTIDIYTAVKNRHLVSKDSIVLPQPSDFGDDMYFFPTKPITYIPKLTRAKPQTNFRTNIQLSEALEHHLSIHGK